MKHLVLVGGFFISSGALLLQAGAVYTVGSGSGTTGTVTLDTTTVHIDGISPSDVNLSDVLEADFTDTPFQLSYFSSVNSPDRLPADWKGTDLGHPSIAGSAAYAGGTLTLTGAGSDLQKPENDDQYFVFGQNVAADAQLTTRIKEIDTDRTQAGPMLRETLDASSPEYGMGVSNSGGGLYLGRGKAGQHVGWVGFSCDLPPIWVRMTRSGVSLDLEVSPDGVKWAYLNQGNTDYPENYWLGFFLNSYSDKVVGKTLFDQITLSPVAAEPDTLPPGVLLRSGSFLAGDFHTTDAHGGGLNRAGKSTVGLTYDQISAIIIHPVTQEELATASSQAGLMMKNGDFLASDIQSVDGGYVTANSLLLGIASYEGEKWRAAVFAPVKAQPSDYEVRLKDGSIVRATGINPGGGHVIIQEVSGVSVDALSDEVAQVRAGTTRVQSMIDLAWQATAPPPPAPVPTTPPVAPATPPAPAAPVPANAPAPPAPAVATDPNSTVLRWAGPNQEQIIAVPVGTVLNFPMPGKFSGIAMRVGVSPDAPPGASVTFRFVADGREVGRTPPIKATDQPVFANLNLQGPRSVSIVAESRYPGVKALLIDPVAIR